MADIRRLLFRGGNPKGRLPHLSFGEWSQFPESRRRIVQLCHPDWRGVRTVAYAFRAPVVECDDLDSWGESLVEAMGAASIDLAVIQGWPPGARSFAVRASRRGIAVKCVLHSSPAQHGAEAGEAAAVDEILALATRGVLQGVGMAKSGVSAAFQAAGFAVDHVPNRVPVLPEFEKKDLGDGLHIGVFAEPFWRKNLPTQLLAAGLMGGSTIHVMRKPGNEYLSGLNMVEHGELPWGDFLALQGSVDVNLYVTLSECHPSTPQESYLAGVPCLISRVSSVFESDPVLWNMTSTDRPDNPEAIAGAAMSLLENRDLAVRRAREWMAEADAAAATLWETFTGR